MEEVEHNGLHGPGNRVRSLAQSLWCPSAHPVQSICLRCCEYCGQFQPPRWTYDRWAFDEGCTLLCRIASKATSSWSLPVYPLLGQYSQPWEHLRKLSYLSLVLHAWRHHRHQNIHSGVTRPGNYRMGMNLNCSIPQVRRSRWNTTFRWIGSAPVHTKGFEWGPQTGHEAYSDGCSISGAKRCDWAHRSSWSFEEEKMGVNILCL